jgi:hypothetical protein
MDNGMITLPNNDDTRPRRKYGKAIKLKVKKPWEVSTGHKEYRDTTMDNRPKRKRTRKAIDNQWRNEYDI